LHGSGATQEVMTEARLADLYGLDFEILHSPRGCLCNYFTSPVPSIPSTGVAV